MVNDISGGVLRTFGSRVKQKMGVAVRSHFLTKTVVEFEQSLSWSTVWILDDG